MSNFREEFKHTWDQKPFDVSWDLPDDITITSCAVSAHVLVPPQWEGADVSGDLLISPTASFSGGTASATTKGGTNKRRYLLRFRAQFSDDVSRKEKVILLIVDDDHDD
jgi:hypothetical protein